MVSFCCEVPSGMLADVLGRRRTLIASQTMFACSAAAMMLSQSMAGVCLAMALNAMAYNLASGTREAITYDSLLQAGRERDYLRISSLQNTLWRGAQALSTLCAGAAAALGYVRGYGVDLLLSLLASPLLRSAFRASPEALAMGAPALRIIALSFFFAGTSIIFCSAFQSLGRSRWSLLVACSCSPPLPFCWP